MCPPPTPVAASRASGCGRTCWQGHWGCWLVSEALYGSGPHPGHPLCCELGEGRGPGPQDSQLYSKGINLNQRRCLSLLHSVSGALAGCLRTVLTAERKGHVLTCRVSAAAPALHTSFL